MFAIDYFSSGLYILLIHTCIMSHALCSSEIQPNIFFLCGREKYHHHSIKRDHEIATRSQKTFDRLHVYIFVIVGGASRELYQSRVIYLNM